MEAAAAERTVYTQLSDEEIDKRAEYKIDRTDSPYLPFGVFVKRRFLWWSWWEEVWRESDIERCLDHLQQLTTLPRRYTRKVVTRP